jgi:hypothetical protein
MSTGPFIVYGVVELSENRILSDEWMRKSFDMNVYFDSNDNPVYGLECSFDIERGISSISKKKKEAVGKFLRMYNEKYKAARAGYYIVKILENNDKTVYSFDEEESDAESDDESDSEDDSDDDDSEPESEDDIESENESDGDSEDDSEDDSDSDSENEE